MQKTAPNRHDLGAASLFLWKKITIIPIYLLQIVLYF